MLVLRSANKNLEDKVTVKKGRIFQVRSGEVLRRNGVLQMISSKVGKVLGFRWLHN